MISVDRITTESADDSVGKNCNAQLIATVPAEAVPSSPETKQHLRNIYDRQGVVMEGKRDQKRRDLHDSTHRSKGQLLVTLSGFKPLMSYFHDVAMLRVWNKGVPTSMADTQFGSGQLERLHWQTCVTFERPNCWSKDQVHAGRKICCPRACRA